MLTWSQNLPIYLTKERFTSLVSVPLDIDGRREIWRALWILDGVDNSCRRRKHWRAPNVLDGVGYFGLGGEDPQVVKSSYRIAQVISVDAKDAGQRQESRILYGVGVLV